MRGFPAGAISAAALCLGFAAAAQQQCPTANFAGHAPPVTRVDTGVATPAMQPVTLPEAKALAAGLLRNAGVTDTYRFATTDEEYRRAYNVMWMYDRRRSGTLQVLRKAPEDILLRRSARLFDHFGGSCKEAKGQFSSAVRESAVEREWAGCRLYIYCNYPPEVGLVHYSLALQRWSRRNVQHGNLLHLDRPHRAEPRCRDRRDRLAQQGIPHRPGQVN